MSIRPEEITIAITVYDRREFLAGAIASALAQTQPVRVMVVEDCGPDPKLKEWVRQRFGDRVDYIRNARNRGLFGNWNACLEHCHTPWLSILHDDDTLRPAFVAAMQALSSRFSECAIYFGRVATQVEADVQPAPLFPAGTEARMLDLAEFAERNLVLFPGQLFRVDEARALGGFRNSSQWAGDWEMWFKLACRRGAAQTAEEVAVCRSHDTPGRGTTRIYRAGRKWALDNVQRKRNLALLHGPEAGRRFRRELLLADQPVPSRCLLEHGATWPRRLLAYNLHLLIRSRAPHARYAALQGIGRLGGIHTIRLLSRFYRWRAGTCARHP